MLRTGKEHVAQQLGLCLVSLMLVAGCGPEVVDHGEELLEPYIVNGQVDRGHPAVGKLGNGCSATLIGQRTVLTANHCVDDGMSTTTFEVAGRRYQGRVVAYPAHWYNADVALLRLSEAVSGVTPRALCAQAPVSGDTITVVGFGITSPDGVDYGTKHWGRNVIGSVEPKIFESPGLGGPEAQTCFGDSGGPALIGKCVAGVASYTHYPFCQTSMGHARVDAFRAWIDREAKDATVRWIKPDPTIRLFRYHNAGNGDHFYTTNWNELGSGKSGYRYEGVAGHLRRGPAADRKPLYRYYNPGNGDHFYTSSWGELGRGGAGYRLEGTVGYVHTRAATGRKKLYRYYNPGNGDHFYTSNWGELGEGGAGYRLEGYVGYIYSKATTW